MFLSRTISCATIELLKKLEKLGAIKLLQTGKRGAHSSRAALYVREA